MFLGIFCSALSVSLSGRLSSLSLSIYSTYVVNVSTVPTVRVVGTNDAEGGPTLAMYLKPAFILHICDPFHEHTKCMRLEDWLLGALLFLACSRKGIYCPLLDGVPRSSSESFGPANKGNQDTPQLHRHNFAFARAVGVGGPLLFSLSCPLG